MTASSSTSTAPARNTRTPFWANGWSSASAVAWQESSPAKPPATPGPCASSITSCPWGWSSAIHPIWSCIEDFVHRRDAEEAEKARKKDHGLCKTLRGTVPCTGWKPVSQGGRKNHYTRHCPQTDGRLRFESGLCLPGLNLVGRPGSGAAGCGEIEVEDRADLGTGIRGAFDFADGKNPTRLERARNSLTQLLVHFGGEVVEELGDENEIPLLL